MAIRDLHLHDVASLRDAGVLLVIDHRTALLLYGVIKIKPLRGFFWLKRIIISTLRFPFSSSGTQASLPAIIIRAIRVKNLSAFSAISARQLFV